MNNTDEDESLHRKRLAQILRYIASMHQALHSADGAVEHSFVRDLDGGEGRNHQASDFFQRETDDEAVEERRCDVLFTTNDFRGLLEMESADEFSSLFKSPPFSFYAATSSKSSKKRTLTGGLKSPFSNPRRGNISSGCWLRIIRLTPSQIANEPAIAHPAVQRYLDDWLKRTPQARSVKDLLTLMRIERAPEIQNTFLSGEHRIIKSFMRKYKKYLRMKLYQQALEPIYNRLFEYIQQQHDHHSELVWSLGHARLLKDGKHINGPLLDILVEVSLAPDGALLVKPREHAGVALNRQIVSALTASSSDWGASSGHSILTQLHRTVAELEPTQFSPAQPATYASTLKRIAVELSPGGSFQSSSNSRKKSSSKLVVSEAWCLYTRLKPSSVWARDATSLAGQLMLPASSKFVTPQAAWSLTHGPNVLEKVLDSRAAAIERDRSKGGIFGWFRNTSNQSVAEANSKSQRPLFPLATSDSQNRIADLLLNQNYPAVVTEGPPGTGKTHSIANIVCAYLCQGKRVLVTSKNSPALSVLRGRLPRSVQELCVDVSMSESSGMRQLQKTVERLANRVSVANAEIETEKSKLLQRSIGDLETQLMDMDKKICHQSERIRQLLQQPDGEKLSGLSRFLIDIAPWLLRTLGSMEVGDLILIHGRLKALKLETHDPLLHVHGFESPPPNALISVALAKSGASLSSLANATRNAVASLPIVGSITGMDAHAQKLHEDLGKVNINGNIPESWEDWKTVANAMRHSQLVHAFENEIWKPNVRSDQWPDLHFSDQHNVREMIELLEKGISVKNLISKLKATEELDRAADCRELDARRGKVSSQIRHHAEELVDAAVVAELSRSFSPDAQSALICFSQIAGAAKFSKSSKPSKMTQRQRRRRQEYLDAFDRCCRFIPCWILTTSQISDYLPPECLFDLVVIDEASQSDVTVLPGMLRGKQWLIVGDGKQVSPTEGFVSEEEIDNLRAALPPGPLESSLLPGHSFFDMCAQAFPRGRVVLSEHFRCAPDIIGFSNEQFYDERLVPLRLPTQSERLSPSLMDVKIDGVKRGKVNEKEADRIVELVQESISLPGSESKPRTIGIISLVGDEQSRLIRGRLLDALGPEKMARHDILIGDPPTFQGAERDIVFLSMVCSRGSVPTQSQLMHFQRANVAMSRARDRCVLVRSIELTDIPSLDDMKIPIIEFFLKNGSASSEETRTANEGSGHKLRKGTSILKNLLQQQGFLVTAMGVIWKDAICVDHINAETRVAIMVDCENESPQEWLSSYTQQKAIERVGWKCLRIDVLSLLIDFRRTMEYVIKYLASAGIEKPTEVDDDEHHQAEPQIEDAVMEVNGEQFQEGLFNGPENDQEVVTVSSEDDLDDRKPAAAPDRTSNSFDFSQEDSDKPSQFGQVVGLDFLRGRTDEEFDSGDDEQFYSINAENGRKRNRKPEVEYSGETEYQNDETNRTGQFDDESGSGTRHNPLEVNNDINNDIIPRSIRTEQVHDNRNFARRSERAGLPNDSSSVLRDSESSGEEQSETGFTSLPSTRSKRRYKRLDKYSRDGRYYPKGNMANGSDHEWMYDTDSDLPRHKVDDGDAVGDGVLFAQSNNQPTEREGKGST